METRKDEIEDAMAQPDFYDDPENVKKFSLEYDELKSDLTDKYSKWEEYQNRLVAIEEEFTYER